VSGASAPRLRAAGRDFDLRTPLLMGIVNATPDSFSEVGGGRDLETLVAHAHDLASHGASIIDVGGESGVTDRPPVPAEAEIERVVPLVARIVEELGVPVSVDTYKPAVARAAVAAGACMVNDVSGLRDLGVADVCAGTGAALVIMHTRTAPKTERQDPDLYRGAGVVADVAAFLAARMTQARERGVGEDQIVLDPGPDFAKTPAQTVAVLQGLGAVSRLGRPVLLALSRKDFIGAVTGRGPGERGAGTLAALAWGTDAGGHLFRVHDVAAAADFLKVRAVLRGELELSPDTALAQELRRV
jgi:dihydropteroate synthase